MVSISKFKLWSLVRPHLRWVLLLGAITWVVANPQAFLNLVDYKGAADAA